MKKVLLVQARVSEDKKTKERLLFVTFVNLPTKNAQTGNIWYPKNDELTTVSCFGEDRAPGLYALLRKANPGTLCGLTYGVNDFNNKLFVANVEILKEGYTEADIYDVVKEETTQGSIPTPATPEKPKKTATTTDGDIPF